MNQHASSLSSVSSIICFSCGHVDLFPHWQKWNQSQCQFSNQAGSLITASKLLRCCLCPLSPKMSDRRQFKLSMIQHFIFSSTEFVLCPVHVWVILIYFYFCFETFSIFGKGNGWWIEKAINLSPGTRGRETRCSCTKSKHSLPGVFRALWTRLMNI